MYPLNFNCDIKYFSFIYCRERQHFTIQVKIGFVLGLSMSVNRFVVYNMRGTIKKVCVFNFISLNFECIQFISTRI